MVATWRQNTKKPAERAGRNIIQIQCLVWLRGHATNDISSFFFRQRLEMCSHHRNDALPLQQRIPTMKSVLIEC
jgi:hypothetical protein